MTKTTTKAGHIAYSVAAAETAKLGGLGICDECNEYAPTGFLVPVLNHYMCPSCFKYWCSVARYYPEDRPVEARNAKYYEAVIGLGKRKAAP